MNTRDERFGEDNSHARIAVVAPRKMRFSPDDATSIDLHIHETVRWSRYRNLIRVFAEDISNPFNDIETVFWPKGTRAAGISDLVRQTKPSLVVVHQHLPTAVTIARTSLQIPVVLIRHNFQKPPRNFFSRLWKQRGMRHLAEIAFVSECCRCDFHKRWPNVRVPTSVIRNGIDVTAWRPAIKKEPLIIFVGRLVPEKGALEAAEAMLETLQVQPKWKGVMIVSTTPEYADYSAMVEAIAERSNSRIQIFRDLRHKQVRDWMSKASIALACTQNVEPFGRVAVEALASETALICSSRGGLKEIVGDNGVLLDQPDVDHLVAAIQRLISDKHSREKLAASGRSAMVSQYDLAITTSIFDRLVARHRKIIAA